MPSLHAVLQDPGTSTNKSLLRLLGTSGLLSTLSERSGAVASCSAETFMCHVHLQRVSEATVQKDKSLRLHSHSKLADLGRREVVDQVLGILAPYGVPPHLHEHFLEVEARRVTTAFCT